MKWIVLEDNPKLDNYIAVLVADEDRVLRAEGKPCTTFRSSEEAIAHARQLREHYKVPIIRFFYIEPDSTFG